MMRTPEISRAMACKQPIKLLYEALSPVASQAELIAALVEVLQ